AASDLGLAFDERRGFAVLAVRFAAARRRAGAFLVPCFFFGELPFAEPRLMAGPHTALEVEYRLCQPAYRGRTIKSGSGAGAAALTFGDRKILIPQAFLP